MGIEHKDGKRIGISFPSGKILYYDIDADDRVYHLKQVGLLRNKLQRVRVKDKKFAEWVREQGKKSG